MAARDDAVLGENPGIRLGPTCLEYQLQGADPIRPTGRGTIRHPEGSRGLS